METRHVFREYKAEALTRLATDARYHPEGWSDTEASDFRLLDQCAYAAKVDTDLRNLRILRITPNGDGATKARATIGARRLIGLTFKDPNTAPR
jgi:hypothetical protein